MNLLNEVKLRMEQAYRYTDVDNGLRLNTHCLYPSHSMVQVSIYGGGSSFYVTDLGGAFREAEAAGATFKKPDAMFQKLLRHEGLSMLRGVITTPSISLDDVPGAVGIVANASKDMADAMFETWRLSKEKTFKERVRDTLKEYFAGDAVKEEKISGTSNKSYSFENVIHLLSGSILVIDPVIRDANSMNSRVVANLDVSSKKYPNVKQRIVYDDLDDWGNADLNLLTVSGVPVVPFSKADQVLSSLRAT